MTFLSIGRGSNETDRSDSKLTSMHAVVDKRPHAITSSRHLVILTSVCDGQLASFSSLGDRIRHLRCVHDDGSRSCFQKVANDGESDIQDNRPTTSLVPELTAQPAVEDEEKTRTLKGPGAKQPCGRVVGIIRRHWREKQYCGSLREEGDRAVSSAKGQSTSALFIPVDRKASLNNTPASGSREAQRHHADKGNFTMTGGSHHMRDASTIVDKNTVPILSSSTVT